MYFDFQDYRPDTPRIPQAVSVREGVLLSVIVHLLAAIAFLLVPETWFERPPDQLVEARPLEMPEREPLRFVEAQPLVDLPAPPERPADASDIDRRSATRERPPDAIDPLPFMEGNTPELVEGAPPAPPPSPPPAPRPAPPQPDVADVQSLPQADEGFAALPAPPAPPAASETASLRESLSNLQQYLRDENFNNPRGGDAQQSADIQFDSMGIDFGPWLLRFKNQVERNWLVPAAAMTYKGRVVIRFNVLRNGYITDLEVVQPASIPALTNAALNALRLSNPTAALPPEYPADKVLFTVTFYYNENPRSSR